MFRLSGERCLNRVADKEEPVGFRELLSDLQNTCPSDRHGGMYL